MSEWDGLDRLIHVRFQAADRNVNGGGTVYWL